MKLHDIIVPAVLFALILAMLPAAPAAAQTYALMVHTNTGYSGSLCYSDSPMTANIFSTCNDQISSVQLRAGWSVRLYRDQNQGGPSFCLNRSDDNLSDNTFEDNSGADNAISSFTLYNTAWCGGAPTPAYQLEVYNDPGYVGTWCYSWFVQTANIFGSCNDQISSVLLRAGWTVRLYREANQSGPNRCLTASDANLADNTYEDGSPMDNSVSSFTLVNQANCGGGTTPPPTPTPTQPPVASSFSISGRVTTPDGRGVAGVGIQASGPVGISTVTDSNGNYALNNLLAGGYQLTAIKSGLSFPPASRFIQGPPSSSSVNFVAKGNVVVLVHGWQGTSNQNTRYSCNNGIYTTSVTDFNTLPQILRDRGYLVYFAQWTTGRTNTIRRSEAAQCLSDQLRQVVPNDVDGKVVLVAHSMGGLVSRSYLEGSDYRGDVERLITQGTPHVGVNLSALVHLFPVLSTLVCTVTSVAGTCDLTSTRTAAYNLIHTQPKGVPYDFVTGVGGNPNWLANNLLNRSEGAHDGIVGRYSGQGYFTIYPLSIPRRGFSSVRTNDVRVYKTADQHTWDVGYFTDDGRTSGGIRCLRRLLFNSNETCERDSTSFLSGAELSQAAPQLSYTPVISETIGAGEIKTFRLALDGTQAAVMLSWDAGDLGLNLRAPDGTVITPQNVGTVTAGGTYTLTNEPNTLRTASYALPQPATGVWEAIVTGDPAITSAIALVGAMESPLELSVTVPEALTTGTPATIVARLTSKAGDVPSPVDGATVSATLQTAGGLVTLAFAPIGPGTYSATLTAPPAGEYVLTVDAVGSTPETFERQAYQLLLVLGTELQSEGAAAAGLVDQDGNKRFDALQVSVPVNVAQNGDYTLGAQLFTTDGEAVAQSVRPATLAAGSQQAVISFAASDIASSGLDGPYIVALSVVRGESEIVFQDSSLLQTEAYSVDVFQTGQFRTYLPVLMR